MKSPVFNALGGGTPPNKSMQTLQQFQDFCRNFRGDPKQIFMQKVQSGEISQQQLNELQGMAAQFKNLIGR